MLNLGKLVTEGSADTSHMPPYIPRMVSIQQEIQLKSIKEVELH
jgi:hypothetical protein